MENGSRATPWHVLLNSSIFQKVHYTVARLGNPCGRLNQGLGVRKAGGGRENLKLSLRRKGQLGSQGLGNSLTHEQDCQGLSSKCFPCLVDSAFRAPFCCPCPCPRHARVAQAAFGCCFLLVIRAIAPKSCFATRQSAASYRKGVS